MTETPQQQPPTPRHAASSSQPRPDEQLARAGASGKDAGGTPDTFGDGSTKEQQDQLVKEAEEANEETKKFADAEREARSDDGS